MRYYILLLYLYISRVCLFGEIIHLFEINGNALLERLPNDIEIQLGRLFGGSSSGAKTHKQCPQSCLFAQI